MERDSSKDWVICLHCGGTSNSKKQYRRKYIGGHTENQHPGKSVKCLLASNKSIADFTSQKRSLPVDTAVDEDETSLPEKQRKIAGKLCTNNLCPDFQLLTGT